MNAVRTLLLCLGIGAATLAQSGQVVGPDSVVDYDYRFTLHVPEEADILGETQARPQYPGSLLLISHPNWGHSALCVESDLGKTLEHWGRQSASEFGFPNSVVELLENATIGLSSGKRIVLKTNIDGRAHRVQSLLVLRKGYVYRLNTWLPAEKTQYRAPSLKPIINWLSLMEGPVRPRLPVESMSEEFGSGWIRKNDLYQNANFGLQVRAPAGTRLLVPDARSAPLEATMVGLSDGKVELWIEAARAITPEPDTFLKTLGRLSGFDSEDAGDALQCTFLGTTIQFRKQSLGDNGESLGLFAAAFRESVLYQISVHCPTEFEAHAIQQIPRWLGSTSALSFVDRDRLLHKLAKHAEAEWLIGFDYAGHGTKWTDFRGAFTWKQPSCLWAAHPLQDNAQTQPVPRLLIKHLSSGIMATISRSLQPKESSLYAAHTAKLKTLGGKPLQTAKRTLSQHPALMTRVAADTEFPLEYRVFSVQGKGVVWHLSFWALTHNWSKAEPDLQRALRGFRFFDEGIPMSTMEAGVLTDHRMGFRLESGFKDAGYTQALIPDLTESGQLSTVAHEDSFTKVVALSARHGAKSQAWFRELIARHFLSDIPPGIRAKARITNTSLSGIRCERSEFRLKESAVSLYFLFLNHRYFAIINSEKPNDPRKHLATRFSIVR